MAGKHEQARGDEGRADGVEPRAGAFTDSEIPGEAPDASTEPTGEYVDSDIPGEAEPTGDGEAGQYTDRDEDGTPGLS